MIAVLRCPACDRVNAWTPAPSGLFRCRACPAESTLSPSPSMLRDNTVDRCAVCGGGALYVQKDFNRGIGLAVVVAGALFSVPTYGLSLVACFIVDLALYHLLPLATACYECGTVYRRARAHPAHAPFDLATLEQHEKKRAARRDRLTQA